MDLVFAHPRARGVAGASHHVGFEALLRGGVREGEQQEFTALSGESVEVEVKGAESTSENRNHRESEAIGRIMNEKGSARRGRGGKGINSTLRE